jgi:peptidyl-prolyl cis-trans isomerase A (cyclophilin A)
MRRFAEFCSIVGLALVMSAGPAGAQGIVRVLMRTELGEIELEVDSARAPITAANFLRYVDAKQYDGGVFHRTVKPDNQPNNDVKIEVIQARGRRDEGRVRHPAIPLERTSVTGLRHIDGALSMARAGPDTARDEFVICIGDQPSLDFGGARNADGQGFAAFGRVSRGMEVVRAIQAAAAEAQQLRPAIQIIEARRM